MSRMMNNIFKTFLQIKTAKNVATNTVYLTDTKEYFEYYYNRKSHTFYINGTNNKNTLANLKAIVQKAYIQELCPLFESSRDKRANVVHIALDKQSKMLVINKLVIDTDESSSTVVL